MVGRSSRYLMVSIILIGVILAAAITPQIVYAEGEVPEIMPLPQNSAEPTSTVTEESTSVANTVELLAQMQTVLVEPSGEPVPMASTSALKLLGDPDPWFFGALCPGGKCTGYTQINLALADWGTYKGYGMIYLEGNYSQTESVSIDGSLNTQYLSLKGIVWDTSTAGAKPQLTGTLVIRNLSGGFTLSGLDVSNNINNSLISLADNKGLVKFTDIKVRNNSTGGSSGGIDIQSHSGAIEFLRVEANQNKGYGAYIRNCVLPACTNTGGVKITSSSFNNNGAPTINNRASLFIESGGLILLNGVSASYNNGDGFDISNFGPAIIKNSVFSGNLANPDSSVWGYGIYTGTLNTGNITLENVNISGNENDGAFLRTTGNIFIKNVIALNNGDTGIRIKATEAAALPGAKNVIVQDTIARGNIYTNLIIYASGSITLVNYQGTNSSTGNGAFLNNAFAVTPLPVSVSKSVFSNNGLYGANIISKGNIILNAIDASNNLSDGLLLDNSSTGSTGSISLLSTLGKNTVINNSARGVLIYTKSNITLSNLDAAENGDDGIKIIYSGSSTPKNVIFTNVRAFDNDALGVFADFSGFMTWKKGGAWHNGLNGALLGGGAIISNTSALTNLPVSMQDVVFDDNLDGSGLIVNSNGAISLNNINASNNMNQGVYLVNNSGLGNVSILRTLADPYNKFNSNVGYGIFIITNGNINLVRPQANGNGFGITLFTCNDPLTCSIMGSVTITGTNAAPVMVNNSTSVSSLEIVSGGQIRLTNIQVNDNASTGASLNSKSSVTINGVANSFNFNRYAGLMIQAQGNILLQNIEANYNWDSGTGLVATNAGGSGIGNIVISATGSWVNRFNGNTDTGIFLRSNGQVNINKVETNENSQYGMDIENNTAPTSKSVLISNSVANGNYVGPGTGIYVRSIGKITLTNVTANLNNTFGADLYNNDFAALTPMPINIINSTFNNNGSRGLNVLSLRTITLNTVTANRNLGIGALLGNNTSTINSPILVIGKNNFNMNGVDGLSILSQGLVTISGVQSIGNLGAGIFVQSNGAILSNIRVDGNAFNGLTYQGMGGFKATSLLAFNNGFTGDYHGVALLTNAKATISNSIIAGNSAWGISADVIIPAIDLVLINTIVFGNDAGAAFDDGNIRIY